jgi:hypothetical protein
MRFLVYSGVWVGLWEKAGSEVRLAGNIHGENWPGFKVSRMRFICQ